MDTAGRGKRKVYTEDFKARAVELAKATKASGGNQSTVAKELGILPNVLSEWMSQAKEREAMVASGLNVAEKQELLALRKENKLLRMEVEFAKKAAAFFAKEIP